MKKIKILRIYTCNSYDKYDYDNLIEYHELKDASAWEEVTDEEYKILTNPTYLQFNNDGRYIVIEQQNKESILLKAKEVAAELARKEREYKKSIADVERKRKELIAKRKADKEAKKLEKARKILADAGEL